MKQQLDYLVIAFYLFEPISDAHAEVKAHKAFLKERDVTARIYISEEGINAQMSASRLAAQEYIEWLKAREPFEQVDIKIQEHHEHVFPRLTVKYRKQIVAIGCDVDLSKRGLHVSPQEWKNMLDKPDDHILIDVRNDYEGKVGHFAGAEIPPCRQFREFNQYLQALKQRVDPKKTPVMMYCTGGIRCEVFSSLMLKEGFEKVYQLQGGVIKYAQQVGDAHWLGKLFVFDDRLTIPLTDHPAPVVGACHHCKKPCESYYNCASMDCNELFLCCTECVKLHHGCCQTSCQGSSRLRPINQLHPHKPFRKWYHYVQKQQLPLKKVKQISEG